MQFNDQTPLAPVAIDSYTAGEIIINQTAYTHNVQLGDNVALFTTAAACRTYALLASEGRKVWAWLWV